MRRTDRRDVHLQVRMRAHERPRCARMVEMDMAEQKMPDLVQRHALVSKP